jgi:hypothetical protein
MVDTPVDESKRFPMHVSYQGIASQLAEKLTNARITVEERPFRAA